jgi:hypothetical protein
VDGVQPSAGERETSPVLDEEFQASMRQGLMNDATEQASAICTIAQQIR